MMRGILEDGDCKFCGGNIDEYIQHMQGSIPTIHSSMSRKPNNENEFNTCQNDMQNFKNRLKKIKLSDNEDLKEFALVVEYEVFENKKPAIDWNRQLIFKRKELPMIKVGKKNRNLK